jgi:hypothetical protein
MNSRANQSMPIPDHSDMTIIGDNYVMPAVTCCVVAPTRQQSQQLTRMRPSDESRLIGICPPHYVTYGEA